MKFPPAQHLEYQLRESLWAPAFVKEHRFHPERGWRLDFAWPDALVAVEVHGAVFTRGRHVQGQGFSRDREKMNEALLLGWLVLEVTGEQVHSHQALGWIRRALSQRNPVQETP